MQSTIKEIVSKAATLTQKLSQDQNFLNKLGLAATILINAKANKGTIYSCGNGGSACEAMHLTEELVARFKRERPGIKAHHLLDPSIMTCWSNDYEFDAVFERQVKTFCTKKDCLVLFSTSGKSKNIIRAAQAAKEIGTPCVGILGKDGGEVAMMCDVALIVPSADTERIQEVHLLVVHVLCELLERDS